MNNPPPPFPQAPAPAPAPAPALTIIPALITAPAPIAAPALQLPLRISAAKDYESWDESSATSSEDSDDEDGISLPEDDGCADELYRNDDAAADAWLAIFPGGTSALYPQLFIVKPRGGKVLTKSRHPDKPHYLFNLPPEIRNRIYMHYFDGEEVERYSKESYAPLLDREGTPMQRILLGSDNVELKFWLSTALLQTARQLRHEAMPILFGNRAITVEWLPALPRLVEFLGRAGCAMMRYLDIWDTLNIQEDDNDGYREILTSIVHLPGLLHLRIVVDWGRFPREERYQSWLDATERNADGSHREGVVAKMRAEDLDSHWPECDILRKLKAQKFTLAAMMPNDKYLEFDRNYGALPGIISSIHSITFPSQSEVSAAALDSQALDHSKAIETRQRSSILTPNSESDDEPDSPVWQDTDLLTNKIIPFYNFFRGFFHENPPDEFQLSPSAPHFQIFMSFPTAVISTGPIMRDCVFCYISARHCGHHSMPDQPPFEFKFQELMEDEEEEGTEYFKFETDVKELQAQFQDLSYVDMRDTCAMLAIWMENHDKYRDICHRCFDFTQISAYVDHLGWRDTPGNQRLAQLDGAAAAGWMGKRVDKEEIPVWDVLYREIRDLYIGRLWRQA